jgi:hypothetical protein
MRRDFWLLWWLVGFVVWPVSCGSDDGSLNPCQQAIEAKMHHILEYCGYIEARSHRDCCTCPCLCVSKGREYHLEIDDWGIPNFNLSTCLPKVPCEGDALEEAEACLADVEECRNSAWWFDLIWPCGQAFESCVVSPEQCP